MIRMHVTKMPIVCQFLNVRFAASCRVIEVRDTVADPDSRRFGMTDPLLSEKPDPVPHQSQQTDLDPRQLKI